MNFVIGFIGALIYLMYFFYQKKYVKQLESKRIKDNISYNYLNSLWINNVVDRDLEADISEYIYNCNNNDEIFNKVIPILNSFPHFDESIESSVGFVQFMAYDYNLMLERILMALNGKLLYHDAEYGILSPPVYDKRMIRLWDINNDLMNWMNIQLKSCGVNYDMKFIVGSDMRSARMGDMTVVKSLDNIGCKLQGKYFWEPSIRSV